MSSKSSKHMKKIDFYFIMYKLSQPLHQLEKCFFCPLCAIHKYDNGNLHIFAYGLEMLCTYDVPNTYVNSSSP
jgi:hypothetical protein